MFDLKVPTKQLDQVKGMLALVPKRMDYGLKLMLNVLAEDISLAQKDLFRTSIEAPTPWTMKAIFVKGATEKDLNAVIGIKDPYSKNTGTMPDRDYFSTLIYGGERPRKGFEYYLQHNRRQFYAMASYDYPLNQYGNISPGKITRTISQLKQIQETGFEANRRGASTIFAIWDSAYFGGLLPGIYERFAMSRSGKVKTGKSAFKRRKGKPALYPRGVRPLMMLSTRPYSYKKQIPWHAHAQQTINANADKAAAIAIRYAIGKG